MKLIFQAVYLVSVILIEQLAAISGLVAIILGISWALINHPLIFIPTVVICIFLIMVAFKVIDLKDPETLERKHEATE